MMMSLSIGCQSSEKSSDDTNQMESTIAGVEGETPAAGEEVENPSSGEEVDMPNSGTEAAEAGMMTPDMESGTMEMAGSPEDLDSDGDGLTDAEEDELNTNPTRADSDMDQFSDFEEVNANTDPLDPNRYPYQGGWRIGDCRDFEPGMPMAQLGDTLPNMVLMDQYGENVHFSDFCDRTILVILQAAWCPPCHDIRAEILPYYEEITAANVMVIEILAENNFANRPEVSDALMWADIYPWPVLIDQHYEETSNSGILDPADDGSFDIPYVVLIRPGLVLEGRGVTGIGIISSYLESLIQ